jgi:hypothetical protein
MSIKGFSQSYRKDLYNQDCRSLGGKQLNGTACLHAAGRMEGQDLSLNFKGQRSPAAAESFARATGPIRHFSVQPNNKRLLLETKPEEASCVMHYLEEYLSLIHLPVNWDLVAVLSKLSFANFLPVSKEIQRILV